MIEGDEKFWENNEDGFLEFPFGNGVRVNVIKAAAVRAYVK